MYIHNIHICGATRIRCSSNDVSVYTCPLANPNTFKT